MKNKKNNRLVILLILMNFNVFANDSIVEAKFDFQKVPQSPAFTLLGISPSQIDHPTSTTDFAASISNATNYFTAIPTAYAVEFNPYFIFSKNKNKWSPLMEFEKGSKMNGEKIVNSLATGSLFSMAVNTEKFNDVTRPKIAIGLKLSLFSGTKLDKATHNEISKLVTNMHVFIEDESDKYVKSELHDSLNKKWILYSKKLQCNYDYEIIDNCEVERNRIDSIIVVFQRDSVLNYNKIHSYDIFIDSTTTVKERLMIELFRKPFNEEFSIINTNLSSFYTIRSHYDSLINDTIYFTTTQITQLKTDSTRSKSMIDSLDNITVVKLFNTDTIKSLIKSIYGYDVRRIGFKWDVSGGLVMGFPTENHNDVKVTGIGLWTVMGWETEKNFSIFGAARFLHNAYDTIQRPENVAYRKSTSIEFGARLMYNPISKLNISAEILGRKTFDAPKLTYRAMAAFTYDLGNNKALSFNIGKDFNSEFTTGGNLVAALNLILGFGSKRNIDTKQYNNN